MNSRDPDPTPLRVDDVLATQLLRLGFAAGARPIDELIARLESPDGPNWFALAMAGPVLAPLNDPRVRPALEVLIEVKDASKGKLAKPADPDERSEGLLGYFLAIGAGMFHHAQNICSRPDSEVKAVLADLATVVPAPWQEVLSRVSLPDPPRGG